jgi:hypothetical protein
MKTWHWIAIGVGTVAVIAVVAKVATSTSATEQPAMTSPVGGVPPVQTGNVEERVASGIFGILGQVTEGITAKVARDDAARERERERQAHRDANPVTDPVIKAHLMGES